MGKKHSGYDFETKVAAARAVVDDGMAKTEAMERFGIASATPLKQWCRLYREGGAEALRPKPKGRPRGSGAKAAPMTREQEPGREVRRLEAQVAYPRKPIALKAELRSRMCFVTDNRYGVCPSLLRDQRTILTVVGTARWLVFSLTPQGCLLLESPRAIPVTRGPAMT
jgi:transposase-like protein